MTICWEVCPKVTLRKSKKGFTLFRLLKNDNQTISRWKAFNIQWKGFYGCIGSTVKVETYLDFLSANKTLNVKPGCTFSGAGPADVLVTSDRVVSFEGDGLFVVQGIEFGPGSTFGVNFRSGLPEGLLFYQSSQVSTRRRRDTSTGKVLYRSRLVLRWV